MKGIVYLLCQRAVYTLNPRQILDPCPGDLLQATQLLQQLLAPLWADPGYLLQCRGIPGPGTPLPVPGNCKTVRLVPYLLNQVQGR